MGAMLSVPAPKSIAGMARSYNPLASVGAPHGRDAFRSGAEEHRGHGPLLQPMGFCRSAPWARCFPFRLRRASRARPAPTTRELL